jgi:hypothetical protein
VRARIVRRRANEGDEDGRLQAGEQRNVLDTDRRPGEREGRACGHARLMNHDSDKEMEILLRRHNRRNAGSVAGAGGMSAKSGAYNESATHMDADELSAYAEGALPDSARSRYASHLADCDSCRKIVTELVISSDVEAKESSGSVAQTIEARGRSWREWLAALFAPPVLRYAAPVVALFAFAAIVFVIVTRNREVTSFVAQNEPNRQQSANTGAPQPNNEQGTATRPSDDNHGNTSAANANAAAQNPAAAPAQTAQREAATATPAGQSDGVSTATSNTASRAANEPQPPPPSVQERAAETKAPAKPVQSEQPSDTFAADRRAKEKDDATLSAQKRAESNEVTTGGTTSAAPATTTRRGRKAEGAGAGALGSTSTESSDEERQKNQAAKTAPAATAGARRDSAEADEDSTAETRAVAGKRFRQQNGVWVDTAYNSSRSVIRVKRGSEQYRALVADEPVVGTVANSFSGAVIVVIRSKAYRIY